MVIDDIFRFAVVGRMRDSPSGRDDSQFLTPCRIAGLNENAGPPSHPPHQR